MATEEGRKRFEQWAGPKGLDLTLWGVRSTEYRFRPTQWCWEAWQAAAQRCVEIAKELKKRNPEHSSWDGYYTAEAIADAILAEFGLEAKAEAGND